MMRVKFFLLVLVSLSFIKCDDKNAKYPTDKRYWDPMDYANVITELKYGYESDEVLPSYKDPESKVVFEKLIDQQNFKVILDDDELGKKHRNEVASDFFMRWRDMNSIYRQRDRKDNFIYDRELIKVWHFGLSLQLRYFKLGNDVITKTSADPNSGQSSRLINSNIRSLLSNFNNYLDEINEEKSFSEEGKKMISEGIDEYFSKLVDLYPEANYSAIQRNIELLNKKSQSSDIKASLTKLNDLIKSKKETQV
ncbi:hypothetical protein J8281_18495 [Aquimarina sp. U1-2]|uniref:hypothetical protein n=1 Tax=Aquimarina sp. U1-2 TaxID=2823141 RepID=UPI001AED02BB|nr:hypothetical protein [Aquimarina sp. U1-2]MBP2834194.1 hypothetical protein [Aquimarina sp. U1-2]